MARHTMTLGEWAAKYGRHIHEHEQSGALYVYPDTSEPLELWDLHHLKDYAVSTVSGPVRWMVPSTYHKMGEFTGNPGVSHGTFAKLRREAVQRGATDPDAYAAFVERKMMHRNPMLHKVESLAPNQTEVSHGDVIGFISYTTPVAIVTRGPGGHYDAFVTDKKWSVTTTRHVRAWLRSRGITEATKKSQKWIEEALEQGTFHAENPPLAILSNPKLTDTITAPSLWASALVNGDDSGLSAEERQHLEVWLRLNNNPNIVDVGEPYSTKHYNLYDTESRFSGGEVADYTVLQYTRSNPRMRRGHMMHSGKAKAGTFSDNVMELRYKHAKNGKLYRHTFNKGVRMRGNEDGTVTLSHPTKTLWGEL